VRILTLGLVLAACGDRAGHLPDAAPGSGADASARSDASPQADASALVDARPADATVTADAFPMVLDVRIDCHNDCTLHATPAAINVSAGTGFEVNWINVGDTTCDVAKIDQFNQVPIIIGLDPGTSYHDPVHTWCGAIFTGTFQFRIDICTLPSYIPVNCGAS
jgi:hypothetical protein